MREDKRPIIDREICLSPGDNWPEYLMKWRDELGRSHTNSGIACHTEGIAYAETEACLTCNLP